MKTYILREPKTVEPQNAARAAPTARSRRRPLAGHRSADSLVRAFMQLVSRGLSGPRSEGGFLERVAEMKNLALGA